jgi:ESF2/ABP1 family protein
MEMEEEDWTDADEEEALAAAPVPEPKAKRPKRGVIYISRIPPHLKPQKLRQMMEQHGELGRLYLAPEAPSLRAKRKKHRGNTGKNFTEGWVEFQDKRVAKQVAAMLNGQPMGGKRRSAYHFDLWCLKYLPKFDWEALTEDIAYQRAVHDQKLAMEISAAKRERDFYLSRVDKSKGMAAIKQRKEQQAAAAAADASVAAGRRQEPASAEAERPLQRVRGYGQRKPMADSVGAAAATLPSSLLSLIAGRPQT